MLFTYIFVVLLLFTARVFATNKCVWVRGAVLCQKDASKQFNVEIRVYDRDGYKIFQAIDPDDLMGVTFTEPDGTFQLDGCGSDFNWFPGVPNNPDPYIQIRHYCNSAKGETLELPEFNTFVPKTHDVGIIVLDSNRTPNAPVTFPTINKPRHKLAESGEKREGEQLTQMSLFRLLFFFTLNHLLIKEDISKKNSSSPSLLWDSSSIELSDSDSNENKTSSYEERLPNLTKKKQRYETKEFFPADAD
ncbi:hypothetical protein Mgra_00000269 [Meloidogyne graminicola]|uniref:Transthyretin-like protein n=1 Tax=Meloidogyne graminicola TaxID=189291 RepID=A0A8T0A4I1_9BILA|nr:hypothetical protein Mgra_00000269 [Meloidogyne graminicola]